MSGKSLLKNNLICRCYFTNNYFIKKFEKHVVFYNRDEFLEEYESLLAGCKPGTVDQIVSDLEAESERRHSIGRKSAQRHETICQSYTPLHRHLYTLQEEFLTREFLQLSQKCHEYSCTVDDIRTYVQVLPAEVYRIPVFTEKFCREFVQEIKHFEETDLPKGRPNTMNNYGTLLEELGFDPGLITPLREDHLDPIARVLYSSYLHGGLILDSHKAFVVHYQTGLEGHDVDLDLHYDNAEITLNVSLEDGFTDGELYFTRMRTEVLKGSSTEKSVPTPCPHTFTQGILHRGQHVHGAMPITSGERRNLIIWMRSSAVRNLLCPMCDQRPTLEEIEGTGDGFTRDMVQVCAVG